MLCVEFRSPITPFFHSQRITMGLAINRRLPCGSVSSCDCRIVSAFLFLRELVVKKKRKGFPNRNGELVMLYNRKRASWLWETGYQRDGLLLSSPRQTRANKSLDPIKCHLLLQAPLLLLYTSYRSKRRKMNTSLEQVEFCLCQFFPFSLVCH